MEYGIRKYLKHARNNLVFIRKFIIKEETLSNEDTFNERIISFHNESRRKEIIMHFYGMKRSKMRSVIVGDRFIWQQNFL